MRAPLTYSRDPTTGCWITGRATNSATGYVQCVNPEHLEPVTQRENALRGGGPTAVNFAKTHCKRGHELTPENTYLRPDDPRQRNCKECKRLRDRAWRKRS